MSEQEQLFGLDAAEGRKIRRPRDIEVYARVVEMLRQGKTYREIAGVVDVCADTVGSYARRAVARGELAPTVRVKDAKPGDRVKGKRDQDTSTWRVVSDALLAGRTREEIQADLHLSNGAYHNAIVRARDYGRLPPSVRDSPEARAFTALHGWLSAGRADLARIEAARLAGLGYTIHHPKLDEEAAS